MFHNEKPKGECRLPWHGTVLHTPVMHWGHVTGVSSYCLEVVCDAKVHCRIDFDFRKVEGFWQQRNDECENGGNLLSTIFATLQLDRGLSKVHLGDALGKICHHTQLFTATQKDRWRIPFHVFVEDLVCLQTENICCNSGLASMRSLVWRQLHNMPSKNQAHGCVIVVTCQCSCIVRACKNLLVFNSTCSAL